MDHLSPLGKLSGCCGAWYSTTPCQCRIPKGRLAKSWCLSGPSLLSSSWPATLPIWLRSWSRRSLWTKWRAWAIKRWVCFLSRFSSFYNVSCAMVKENSIMQSPKQVLSIWEVLSSDHDIFSWKDPGKDLLLPILSYSLCNPGVKVVSTDRDANVCRGNWFP